MLQFVTVPLMPCRWSDSPLVRRPIGPKTHWSDGPLVRKPIGPKTHWSKKTVISHWSENHWSEKVCHWSENPLVRKSVIGPKIAEMRTTMWCQNPTPLSVENWLFNTNKVYSFTSLAYQPLAIRNSAIKKKPAFLTRNVRTNDTFSDQWVFGPMTHFFGPMVFAPMTLFRTNGSSDQWVFGPMGRRTNGFSDQWVVGPMGCRTIETSPYHCGMMSR